MKIHGREYRTVNEKIEEFRKEHPDWTLSSELIKLEDNYCVFKATIQDPEGRVIATGHADEVKTTSGVNRDNYLENCETSAWGRALSNAGYSSPGGVASAEDMERVKEEPEPKKGRQPKTKQPQEVKNPWQVEDLKEAIKVIAVAQTTDELAGIFNANQHLHPDEEFREELTRRKLELKEPMQKYKK